MQELLKTRQSEILPAGRLPALPCASSIFTAGCSIKARARHSAHLVSVELGHGPLVLQLSIVTLIMCDTEHDSAVSVVCRGEAHHLLREQDQPVTER
jgi:hypothetical protein